MAEKLHHIRPTSEHRLFVRDGFRSFRKTYALSEVGWGVATTGVLLGVVFWVAWRGAHPDPELFDVSAALQTAAATPPAERGALPDGLAFSGWQEGKLARFDADNLYEKINGRAGFFKSFGVQQLYSAVVQSQKDPSISVDIELYDMAESKNALGAYNGERPAEVASSQAGSAMYHEDRNAAYLAQGRFYARFIGSDESAQVKSQLKHLLSVFQEQLPSDALPWGYALLGTHLGLGKGAIRYERENAFSFGFASNVYTATVSEPDADVDTMLFVAPAADEASAEALADKYVAGFASIGQRKPDSEGVRWTQNEFLATYAGVMVSSRWVLGIKGAPQMAEGLQWLHKLRAAVQAFEQAGGKPEIVGSENADGSDAVEPAPAEADGPEEAPVEH